MAPKRVYENGYVPTDKFPEYIEHYLYFPQRSNAERAALHLRERGWTTQVKPAAAGSDWLAFATQPATGEEDMDLIYDDLSAFAKRFKGVYDGWEHPMTEGAYVT
jgi:Regulator of ribonuclease activity B